MAQRLSWWVIPGALVVLCRVATLAGDAAPSAAEPVDAAALPDRVTVREASGTRHVAFPLASFTTNAFVVAVPAELAGRKVAMTIWRRIDGKREATPWLTLEPRVRGDATLPIAGLAAGRYDLVVRAGDGAAAPTLAANDVEAPGHAVLGSRAPVAVPAPLR